MTTAANTEEHNLLLAEYALGVLDRETRGRVARQVQENAAMAVELALWQQLLEPLADDVPPVAPRPEVWQRIQGELGFFAQRTMRPARRPAGLWDNLRFWRWLGLGATAGFAVLAVASVAFMAIFVSTMSSEPSGPAGTSGVRGWIASLQPSRLPSTPPVVQGYRFANLMQPSGAIGWTATMDAAQARMIVVPAAVSQVAANRSAELWLVPEHGKPVALGLLAGQHAVIVLLSDAVMQAMSGAANLAVSIEPVGGSRTGQPTGPIVAQGAIRAA